MALTRTPCRSQRGFALLELLVATLLVSLILGAAFSMLQMVQFTSADMASRAEAHGSSRAAMVWLQRDLLTVGLGVQQLIAPFPVIVPQAGGGVELRSSPGNIVQPVTNMTALKNVFVDDASGFSVGQEVTLYDDTGTVEVLTVTHVAHPRITVTPSASKNFSPANGAAIAFLERVVYEVDSSSGTPTLMREVSGEAAQPLALNVVDFTLTYFDDSSPSVAFVPVTNTEMLRIRSLEVALEVGGADDPLLAGTVPSFRLTSRIAPRALALLW